MEKVCPICNGLEEIDEVCPQCGHKMLDGGALQNYLGPYSPYVESDMVPLNMTNNGCVHLVYCPNCNFDIRMSWDIIII